MLWFSRVSSGASVINGLALALGFYWPAVSSGLPRALVILGVLGGLTWANLRGIKQASWLVNGFTIGKILPLVDLRRWSGSGPPISAAWCRRARCRWPTPARPRCC